MTIAKKIDYKQLSPADFEQVIALANLVHGDGYLTAASMQDWYQKGLADQTQTDLGNVSYVAYHGDKLVGFRITYAANHWLIDEWCSPELWQTSIKQVCYFKCNTVDQHYRGYGVGSELLKRSITAAKTQGASAGIAHLWQESPGNSAIKYFTKCGGQLLKIHPNKWHQASIDGYDCILCGRDCHCSAAEMIIYF